jgi:phosphotransferase system  glucose/maltose/N-acetylglucosamine-specific IIC component
MKKYFNILYKTFFFITLLTILLNVFINRRYDVTIAYNKISLSVLLSSIFIALAIRVFKSDKGKGYINAVLGYIIIIPTLLVIRATYGQYLFKFTYTIYIIMAVIGLIYGVALLVASKRYKSEVDELNRLLLKKENNDEVEDDE